jgi:hypothetical protein
VNHFGLQLRCDIENPRQVDGFCFFGAKAAVILLILSTRSINHRRGNN